MKINELPLAPWGLVGLELCGCACGLVLLLWGGGVKDQRTPVGKCRSEDRLVVNY